MNKPEYPTVEFKAAPAWREWLDSNTTLLDGVWLRIYKKASGISTVTYDEALQVALCYGWIDGIKKTYDEISFIQKFTPRRKASLWSKRNVDFVAQLTEAGLMMPAGIAEVERAKADGRWQAAYDKPSEMKVPNEFMVELKKHPKAEAMFQTLNKTNTYAIAWRLQTAKTETTRLRRQEKIITLLNNGQKLH